LDRLHEIWLKLSSEEQFGSRLHHRDVIGLALTRLELDLTRADREEIVKQLSLELRKS